MPFNLDAVVVEAEGKPFEFTFGGESFALPPSVDILAAASLEGGKLYDGLRKLLGPDQWDRLVALNDVLDQHKLVALMQAYGDHLGIGLGESPASTDS